jgi:hypothetical protein
VNHNKIIGKQVLVEYFDQNINFATIFPLTGTVTEKIKVDSQDFFVVEFAKFFVYNDRSFDKIIFKERHVGQYIGGGEEIHVHVCLFKKEFAHSNYELTDLDHVAWATINIV